ncbi:MAG: hypothetical protein K5641_04015 [Lachnospiraceae bacterium]|nr:hypothetical protein [Lachnospiraceae bacterium]
MQRNKGRHLNACIHDGFLLFRYTAPTATVSGSRSETVTEHGVAIKNKNDARRFDNGYTEGGDTKFKKG